MAAVLTALALWHPDPSPAFRVCGFLWLTGRPCPLCGMTRAFAALAHGEVGQAVRFNLVSPVVFVLCLVAGLTGRLPKRIPVIAPLVVYGVLRAARVLP